MGSSNNAVKQAKRQERERQAAIAAGTTRVNEIFDAPERASDRGDFLTALRDQYMTNIDRQKGDADRRLRFAMARSGLSGGSAAADQNRRLGEEYTQNVLNADTRAQGAWADLEAQDEQARLNLLQMVQSGMDATTAGARASEAMRTNAQSARAGAAADSLGDLFGSTADIYKRMEEEAARRRGEQAAYGAFGMRKS